MVQQQRGSKWVAPVVAALVTAVPGIAGLVTHQLWLFPSLGPTAVMQAHEPRHPSSRPYNAIVGHFAGLLSGYAAVALFGISWAPSVFELHALSGARVAASALAILLAVSLELVLRAPHPPAASTTLLAALGSFKPTWHDATDVIVGVLIVVAAGELGRRVRSRDAREHAQAS